MYGEYWNALRLGYRGWNGIYLYFANKHRSRWPLLGLQRILISEYNRMSTPTNKA